MMIIKNRVSKSEFFITQKVSLKQYNSNYTTNSEYSLFWQIGSIFMWRKGNIFTQF